MADDHMLHVIGVNHRVAPIEVREALALNGDDESVLLDAARRDERVTELLVLSTCNRTELYAVAPTGVDPLPALHEAFASTRAAATCVAGGIDRFVARGPDAVRHLFRVAAGLESAILGDQEVIGQLRRAVDRARTAGTLGAYLDPTIRAALRAAKEARATTDISAGGAGVGSAVASLVHEECGADALVVVVGAGAAGQSTARALAKRGHRLVIVNRTLDTARELVASLGGVALSLRDLEAAIGAADAVVAATAAPTPVITRAMARAVSSRFPGPTPLVIDAGLPRNVEEGSFDRIVTVDALREREARSRVRREAAVPAAEAVIERHLDDWTRWEAERRVESLIRDLYRGAAMVTAEAATELAQRKIIGVDDVERLLQSSMKRLLHGHVRRLREVAAAPEEG